MKLKSQNIQKEDVDRSLPSFMRLLLSPQKISLIECTASSLISPESSHHFFDVGLLSVTFSPTQSCGALVIDRSPAYLARRSVWRDIGVGSGLTTISLITRPLFSLQNSLMGCAAPPFISSGPSHHFSDVGFLSITLGPIP